MKLIKRIGLGLGLLLIIFVVVGLILPTEYQVERSILIQADTAQVHQYVGDLTKWASWSPWKENDPSVVVTPGEKSQGVGASQAWLSDNGGGSLIFVSSSPVKGVEYDLVFDAGKFKSESALLYHAQDGATRVTWQVHGEIPSMPILRGYIAWLMDGEVGPLLGRGLEKLRLQVEGAPP